MVDPGPRDRGDQRLTVGASRTVCGALRLLERCGADCLPVVDRGRVVGVLSRKTASRARHYGLGNRPVRDVLAEELPEAGFAKGREVGEENVSRMLRERLPRHVFEVLRLVGRLARRSGGRAYLVGGVVRDLLLGGKNADLDVAVEGDACKLADLVTAELGGRARIHPAFQTAVVFLSGGLRLDLATTRTERYRRPAALPEVSPGGLRQDLFRRDFSINALAIRLSPAGFGELLDYFGGRQDLRSGTIRVLHGLSFIEDPTRAFRAVRFANRLNFSLSARTARQIGVALREGVFARLSPQRLRRELEQLFTAPRCSRALGLLTRLKLLAVLHPALKTTRQTYSRLDRAERLLDRHRGRHEEKLLRWAVVLGVLMDGLDRRGRAELLQRLRPGRVALRILSEAPERAHRIGARLTERRSPSPGRIHANCRGQPTEILLLAMALTPSAEVRRLLAHYLDDLRGVRPDITGSDMIRAGIPEGPGIAAGLEAALRAKLDGKALTAEEQLAVALKASRFA